MGRANSRGFQLSFKPSRGGRGRGRWFKKVKGREIYFGWGDGVSDRPSYHAALNAYHQWTEAQREDQSRLQRTAISRRMQHAFSVLDLDPDLLNLKVARDLIEQASQVGADKAVETYIAGPGGHGSISSRDRATKGFGSNRSSFSSRKKK